MTNNTQKKQKVGANDRIELANHLLKFEKFSLENSVNKLETTDEELNSRYVKGKFLIVTEQVRYPLAGILAMLKEEILGDNGLKELRYKLDPEYQRRHRWNVERKSRLIESFLMNVPVPPVFLYERDLARFEVIDGCQRLTALSDFYADEFTLTGMRYWTELNGRKYSQLPSKIRDGIDRRYISSVILLKETAGSAEQAAMLKKIVFERLNSGGVRLANQETRNAVHGGPLSKLCLELSENDKFQRMWGIPFDPRPEEKDADEECDDNLGDSTKAGSSMFEKMEDVELVLRFFAYRKIGEFKEGLNKISELLDRFIVEGNKFSSKNLALYRSMFEETINFLWDALDCEAFTTLDPAKKRPTKIVYDPLMFVASGSDMKPHRANLIKNKAVLRGELKAMYGKNPTLFSGRNTNFKDTQDRNRLMSETFANAIAKLKK